MHIQIKMIEFKIRNLSNPSILYFDCTYFCTSNKWSTREEISEVENDAIEISFEEHYFRRYE